MLVDRYGKKRNNSSYINITPWPNLAMFRLLVVVLDPSFISHYRCI